MRRESVDIREGDIEGTAQNPLFNRKELGGKFGKE